MNFIQQKIVNKILSDAFASGYTVSVWDGEEWTVKSSTNRKEILSALATTCDDVLAFRRPDKSLVGKVLLVYGNDYDLITDYTDNEAMVALLSGAEKLAEKF